MHKNLQKSPKHKSFTTANLDIQLPTSNIQQRSLSKYQEKQLYQIQISHLKVSFDTKLPKWAIMVTDQKQSYIKTPPEQLIESVNSSFHKNTTYPIDQTSNFDAESIISCHSDDDHNPPSNSIFYSYVHPEHTSKPGWDMNKLLAKCLFYDYL